MRKWLGVALVLAAAFCLFLLTFYAEKTSWKTPAATSQAAKETSAPSISIRSAQLANSGNGTVAVMRVLVQGDQPAMAFCSSKPIQRNVVLLKHAGIPGMDKALPESLSGSLQRCGLSVQEAGMEELALMKDTVIISAAGATPAGLNEIAVQLAERNNLVILVEVLEGRGIAADGSIAPSNKSPFFRTVVYRKEDKQKTVDDAVADVLSGQNDAGGKLQEVSLNNSLVAVPVNSSVAYCRLFYYSENGGCRVSDSGKLSAAQGTLAGPSEVLAGKNAAFEFSLNGSSEIGRNLSLAAVIMKDGAEVGREGISEGGIAVGYASRILLHFPHAGDYLVWVTDQFGRVHAEAYVKAAGLASKQVSHDNSRYEYYLEFAGEPAEGAVRAWIDEGEKKSYFASNGTLEIWAAPGQGKHNISFEHQGAVATEDMEGNPESLLASYARIYIPAAIFLVSLFLLLGAAKKVRYSITFPRLADEPVETVCLSEEQLLRACIAADGLLGGHRLALLPEEIGRAALKEEGKKRDCRMDLQSLGAALDSMVADGSLVSSSGYYAPAAFANGFDAQELCLLRNVHNALLERGISFSKKRIIPIPKSGIELQLFSGKGAVLSKIGKAQRVVLFRDMAALEEFERSLGEPEKENVRIKLALSNGKIVFATAGKESLEAVLP